MSDFFSISRRYDFTIPVYSDTANRKLTKSQQLNLAIKKFLIQYLSSLTPSSDYYVEGDTFYTPEVDTVSGNTLVINSGRATVDGDTLVIDGTYRVLNNILYTTSSDSVSNTTWNVASGTVDDEDLKL